MKYLKKFEDKWSEYKYQRGDCVLYNNEVYEVGNASPGWDNIRKNELRKVKRISKKGKVITAGGLSKWIPETELTKIDKKDIEFYLQAKKYNL